MWEKIYFFLYIFLFKILLYESKKIIIPFKTVHNTESNYIKSLLQYQIYTKLDIGTTRQTAYIAITTDNYIFAIESSIINETFYSAKKSTSYKNNSSIYYYTDKRDSRMKSGDVLNETFYFSDSIYKINENMYNNIMFNYITELSQGFSGLDNGYIDNNINLISGIIGLQITRYYSQRDEIIFMKSLKNIDAIDKLVWSIYYLNDNEGYLLFGEYPHEYNNNYNEDDYKKINCITVDYEYYWYFIFTDIKIGDNKINEFRTAQYAPQLGLIIGTNEYREIISNYFANFTKSNNCFLNTFKYKNEEYSYYECDKNINIDDFEPITFIIRDAECTFSLDKEDLFVDYNNKKYFLVIFQKSNNQIWKLGKPFVKKYYFAFDQDNKKILSYGLFKSNNNGNNNNENDNNNNIGIKILIYASIAILGILVVILGIFLGKKIFGKKKKKKANELEDNLDEDEEYQKTINNNNENNTNDYNKIIN